jgi:hypothetical protein
MADKRPRLIHAMADTQYDIDTREAPRYGCPRRPVIRLTVRPSFAAIAAGVRDISTKGVGLLCEGPIEPGSSLAVLWDYGPPHSWRTLRAHVARTAPRRRGGWLVGCLFDERLEPDDLEAFLRHDHEPAEPDPDA